MTTEVLGTANPETSEPPASWIPDDSAFGARLALIRQRMSWGNVKEAALACGVPVESWRAWERDNVLPRNYPNICRQIAERTGCDLGWLMDVRERNRDVSVRGKRSTSPYAETDGVTVLFPQEAVRPTWNRGASPDHRPSGHPNGGTAPGNRRPSRLPRPGTSKRS